MKRLRYLLVLYALKTSNAGTLCKLELIPAGGNWEADDRARKVWRFLPLGRQ